MKKGFTLVELLAVIVILSIIVVITIPMIKGVIDKVKLGSLEDSVYGLKSAAELYFSSNEKLETTEFICNDNGCLSDSGKKLDYKGKVEGKVKLFSDGKVSICLTSDNYASSILASDKKATTKMGGCDEETYEISEVIAIEKYNKVNSDYLLVKNTLYNKTLISNINNDANTISQEINNIDLNQNDEINRLKLVEALKYSGLVNENMTYDEMLSAVNDYFDSPVEYDFTLNHNSQWGSDSNGQQAYASRLGGYSIIDLKGEKILPINISFSFNGGQGSNGYNCPSKFDVYYEIENTYTLVGTISSLNTTNTQSISLPNTEFSVTSIKLVVTSTYGTTSYNTSWRPRVSKILGKPRG